MKKVSVIGAGNVGATCAFLLAQKSLAEVVLVDIVEGIPQGKALDMLESGPILGFSAPLRGTNSYEDTAGSDIVVITAGMPRKPGMSRMDLLKVNADIIKDVARNIAHYSPQAIIVVVTNPLDVMAYVAWKVSGFAPQRVMGQAGVLDAARLCSFVAMELQVNPADVQAMVLGSHGDSMVPLPRYTTVSGVPITQLMDAPAIERLVERTRKGGAEIVSFLKTGSAYYAPAASTARMVEAILLDAKALMPASAYLDGDYGHEDVFIGVPAILGVEGVERIVRLELSEDERAAFEHSVEIFRKNAGSVTLS